MARVDCPSCSFREPVEPTEKFPMYCPDCGERTSVKIDPSQPDETRSDKV